MSNITVSTMTTPAEMRAQFGEIAKKHLSERFANNPEFEQAFKKTFSDLIFSRTDEELEQLLKIKQNTLLNAVFVATEAGASFAKKEISLIPFKIKRKEVVNGVERLKDTGEYTATIIIDINYQKQQIFKLENCKRFFTAEIKEGVKIIQDLETGNYTFSGENDVTKRTVGYYAVFLTTDGEKYDLFMTNAEIIERAKMNPSFDQSKYKSENNNIHFEKIVVRNLIKEIPKVSKHLQTSIAIDEVEFTEYHEIEEAPQKNALEDAKRAIFQPEIKELINVSEEDKAGKKTPVKDEADILEFF